MPTLSTENRRLLERTVVDARRLAERAARAALEALAVGRAKPDGHMSDEQKALRNHLRARARQLGDGYLTAERRVSTAEAAEERGGKNDKDSNTLRPSAPSAVKSSAMSIERLAQECAYEQWHRMLFARFLAENNLLIEPDAGVAISLDECKELAKEEKTDLWTLAGRYAQRMLPQIFRADDPVLKVRLAREHELKLEGYVDGLPTAVFTATDSLGWCYQFWQTDEKKRVNESEKKIGADELPAVTQLFTEDYMVDFLLDNTLGAWWAGKVAAASSRWSCCKTEEDCRRRAALPGCTWKYLRFAKAEQQQDVATTLGFFHKDEPVENLTGDLPHWRQSNVTYFVTFRCADSLPAEKLAQWREEMTAWLTAHPEPRDEETRRTFYKLFPERMQQWLDTGHGRCLLGKKTHETLVANALRHFDGDRYDLDQFVVAPNHVHVLVTPRAGSELSDILNSWKSFTANAINKAEGLAGTFWQKESFDHIVRNEKSLNKFREYIRGHKVESASNCCDPPEQQDQRQDAAATLWKPAAGTFPGWPKTAKELKCMDPCCGSGHFLVAMFERLVAMRMAEEGLKERKAAEAVLRDNIFGLEIDPRCTQIAAFNLALAAWRDFGYGELPVVNIACSGLGINATRQEWLELARGEGFLMGQFYDMFRNAPTLGSLIDPRGTIKSPHGVEPVTELGAAVANGLALFQKDADFESAELGVAAQGIVAAFRLLSASFHLVVTNVPYLGRGKQDAIQQEFIDTHYELGKADLATAFLLRCMRMCKESGTTALVVPQNWLTQHSYKALRQRLYSLHSWKLAVRIGEHGFSSAAAAGAFTALVVLDRAPPSQEHGVVVVDVSVPRLPEEKAALLHGVEVAAVEQGAQSDNPDGRFAFGALTKHGLLSDFADSFLGLGTGDYERYGRCFWEFPGLGAGWSWLQSASVSEEPFDGLSAVVAWDKSDNRVRDMCQAQREKIHNQDQSGQQAWGRAGVAVALMRGLRASMYLGTQYEKSMAVLVPKKLHDLPAIWAFCRSSEFHDEVRKIDHNIIAANGSLVKVPFDRDRWIRAAASDRSGSLPKPATKRPTQWVHTGHPARSADSLQVGVARLLGYLWPRLTGSSFPDCPALKADGLEKLADADGIVCIPSVRGEPSAADRLLRLPTAAGVKPDCDLDDWLRNSFFEEHCKLFHDRPFVWHIWDGRNRDGFHALVNYHKLADGVNGRRLLEKLTHAYLGDWITRQRAEVKDGKEGADARLAAALALKDRLEAILKGEPPFDIFVRWKPLAKQAIGWEPDINDGVRMNIRPFMASGLLGGKKGAGVLRVAPKIKWTKDRGKEPHRPIDEYPWFWSWDEKAKDFMGGKSFDGNRWNDCHYSNDVKTAARKDGGKL